MARRLEGKVALVTGGARGQGAAIAEAMIAEGASVVLADILDDLGKLEADRLGPRAAYAHLDVSEETDWSAAMDGVNAQFGPVTVLVNNAGVLSMGTLESMDLSEYRRLFETNQFGCLLGMRAVVPGMRVAGGGSIINTSSIAGLVGIAGAFAYSSSKWAVRGMTRSAALHLGVDGIRVNSLHPGTIDTPMIRSGADDDDARAQGDYAQAVPLGRMGVTADVTGIAVFLASDESAYCTGGEFVVDGGYTCGARY